jgi:IS5 family transposase
VTDCNERILRHGLKVIQTPDSQDADDHGSKGGVSIGHTDQSTPSTQKPPNQGPLLIDAICAPVDIRHQTDLALMNEAREVTEILIDAMHPQIKEKLGQKPRTHHRKVRQQLLAIAKKKRPRINKILKVIKQQLGHPSRIWQALTP